MISKQDFKKLTDAIRDQYKFEGEIQSILTKYGSDTHLLGFNTNNYGLAIDMLVEYALDATETTVGWKTELFWDFVLDQCVKTTDSKTGEILIPEDATSDDIWEFMNS